MHGYLMMKKQLVCHVVDTAHKKTFANGNRKFKYVPYKLLYVNAKNKERTAEEKKAKVERLLQMEKDKRQRIKELGIPYDFPGYVSTSKNANPSFTGWNSRAS